VRVVWNATQLVAIVQQLALASGDEEYQKAATEVIREMSAAVTALVVLHAAQLNSTCKPRLRDPTDYTHSTLHAFFLVDIADTPHLLPRPRSPHSLRTPPRPRPSVLSPTPPRR
jgi:hypothetical protein